MTMIFSAATDELIAMTVDSAILNEFTDRHEYERGIKYYPYDGVGCVTTWGERVGNTIGRFLDSQGVSPDKYSIYELCDLVNGFLTKEYRPHDLGSGDVGYHVAGFDQEGLAVLHHIYWGFPRPNPQQNDRDYRVSYHSPTRDKPIQLLYNGRNDIADTVVNLLIREIEAGKDVNFDVTTPIGLACFGDFVARLAGELTPEVSPPFTTILISPQNRVERITNSSFCPLDREKVSQAIRLLESQPSDSIVNPTRESRLQAPPEVRSDSFTAPSGAFVPPPDSDETRSSRPNQTVPPPLDAGTASTVHLRNTRELPG